MLLYFSVVLQFGAHGLRLNMLLFLNFRGHGEFLGLVSERNRRHLELHLPRLDLVRQRDSLRKISDQRFETSASRSSSGTGGSGCRRLRFDSNQTSRSTSSSLSWVNMPIGTFRFCAGAPFSLFFVSRQFLLEILLN